LNPKVQWFVHVFLVVLQEPIAMLNGLHSSKLIIFSVCFQLLPCKYVKNKWAIIIQITACGNNRGAVAGIFCAVCAKAMQWESLKWMGQLLPLVSWKMVAIWQQCKHKNRGISTLGDHYLTTTMPNNN
jgi:hypothetical protein